MSSRKILNLTPIHDFKLIINTIRSDLLLLSVRLRKIYDEIQLRRESKGLEGGVRRPRVSSL